MASDQVGADLLARIQLTPVGPANVVQLLGTLAKQKRLPYRAVAAQDGDASPHQDAVVLPGTEAPEVMVFNGLRTAGWPQMTDRFGIGAGTLFSALEDAMLEPDHHQWTTMVGDRVRKSANGVWEILAAEWARNCLIDDERKRIVSTIADALGS